MKKVIGIIICGKIKTINDIWQKWLEESEYIIKLSGQTPTHFGIVSKSFEVDKLRTFSRSGKKLKEVISSGELIECLSFYSLKKGFHTVLDSDITLLLHSKREYVYCEFPIERYDKNLAEEIQNKLIDFVDSGKGEVFSIDKDKVAFNYARKSRGIDINKYPTLQILWNINN